MLFFNLVLIITSKKNPVRCQKVDSFLFSEILRSCVSVCFPTERSRLLLFIRKHFTGHRILNNNISKPNNVDQLQEGIQWKYKLAKHKHKAEK